MLNLGPNSDEVGLVEPKFYHEHLILANFIKIDSCFDLTVKFYQINSVNSVKFGQNSVKFGLLTKFETNLVELW